MFKRSMLILFFLILLAGGGAYYGMTMQQDTVPLAPADVKGAEAEEKSGKVTVYVTGAVNHPGLVTLSQDSRIGDAVDEAGGLLPTADAERVNLAKAVKDGQQIRIPSKQEAASGAPSGGKNGDGLVNINTADEKTLDSLPGVGPSTAQAIIQYRESEGSFSAPEDLMKVKGIGKGKFEKLKDKITI